jgi:hypothetical protein
MQQKRETASALADLWRLIVTGPVPEEKQFIIWLGRHTEDVLCDAIEITARKSAVAQTQDSRTMSIDDLIRYTSATANNLTNGDRQ